MAVLEKIKAFVGVPVQQKGVDRIAQLEAAETDANRDCAEALEAKEAALYALEDGDRGAAERLAIAQRAVEAATQARDDIRDHLRAARLVADRRAADGGRKARAASWRQAERLADERVAVAGKLTEALRLAGELYAELVRLGLEAHQAMPTRMAGGPSMYRLSPGDAAAVVGIDVLRAGLPRPAQISPSMLDQYPTSDDVAASSAEMIKLARREDEAS